MSEKSLVNRKKISDFLETGKGKKEIESLLEDEDSRLEYLEQARMEAALYQVWEEKSTLKLKRKPVRIPLFKILAFAALIGIGFFIYKQRFNIIATHTQTAGEIKPGEYLEFTGDAELVLQDGSTISFKGPSKAKFLDENNIEVYEGFLDARVNPRIDNKLTIKTPSGPFTVIGTEFSLWVKGESTLLDVTEGKVSVANKLIQANERALLKKSGELLTNESDLEFLSAGLILKKMASLPAASIVSDFTVRKGSISNMVTGEKIPLQFGIKKSKNGLSFNEGGAIQINPAGEPGLEWNLSLWIKYDSPKDRKAVVSHENFVDKNMGGWNLYCFEDYMRVHTVMQPYLHDRGDYKQDASEWFHLSINTKTLGHGMVEEKIYIDGLLKETHHRKMLFLKNQVNFYLGGLSENAMSAFAENVKKHNFYFKGELANLVYMNSTLSEKQIKALYKSSSKSFK